jgi:DNA-binding response OmpR family regulator
MNERQIGAQAMPDRGRILIVDDDPTLRALVRVALGGAGFEVLEAENGADGVRLGAESDPDLIITDWEMPVMDGYDTIRALRSDAATATKPILMLTTRSQTEDIVAALDAGAQDFIIKPFRKDELIARIEQQLRWRQLLRSDVPAPDPVAAVEAVVAETIAAPVEAEAKRPVQEAMDRGDVRGALDLAVAEAERAESERDFMRAAGLYRGGSSAARRMNNPDLANKLLRLAGKMYLSWAETARADGTAIEEAYGLAARMFMAAGNLKVARRLVERQTP